MAITYHTEGTDFLFKRKGKTTSWIKRTAASEGYRIGNLAVVFCSDDALLKINRQYLDHDFYTDIISFDYTDPVHSVISGDLMISVDTVASNARQYDTTFEQELDRVIIHGILHLVGYGDKTPEEKAVMRQKEDYYLYQKEG